MQGIAATLSGAQAGYSFAKGQDKVIGLSLPLSGNQAEVARDLQLGYGLALKAAGSDLQLLVLDDGGDATRTATNVQALASNPNVLVLSGVVGTPHAQQALPIAAKAGLPVIGIRSGAKSLRDGRAGVFHLRSSFEDELDKIANMCAGAGLQTVGIIHSDDSFGKGSREHLVGALKAKGVEVLAPMPVARDGTNLSAVAAQCASAVSLKDKAAGVVLLMIAKPMTDTTKALREVHKIALPIFTMSFVATRSFSTEATPYLTGLGLVSAFPIPQTSYSDASKQFRRECIKADMPEIAGSLTAYEGYFYGSVIALLGAQTREQMVQKMQAGVRFADQAIKPDASKVAYHYLEIVRKSADGKLKS